MLSSQQVQDLLPQAYPFVMIDRVVELQEGKSLTAIKNLTAGDWPFCDEQYPVKYFPETLLIEAAAQAALLLYRASMGNEGEGRKFFLGKVKAEFLRPVNCGEQLRIVARATKVLSSGGYSDVEMSVGEDPVGNVGFVLGAKKE